MLKKCLGCRRIKDAKLFSKDASRKDGRYHYCKHCSQKRLRKYFKSPAGKEAIRRATALRTMRRRQAAKRK